MKSEKMIIDLKAQMETRKKDTRCLDKKINKRDNDCENLISK